MTTEWQTDATNKKMQANKTLEPTVVDAFSLFALDFGFIKFSVPRWLSYFR
jgi:hypothetical protein